MKHLSDEQIQDYIDGHEGAGRSEIERHLESCPACRREVKRYRLLSLSLSRDEGFELAPDFSSQVVASLQEQGAERLLYRLASIILWVGGLMAALALLIRFTDFENAFKSLGNLGRGGRGFLNTIIDPLMKVVESTGVNLELVGGVIAVLLMIYLVDRVITRARKHATTTSLI